MKLVLGTAVVGVILVSMGLGSLLLRKDRVLIVESKPPEPVTPAGESPNHAYLERHRLQADECRKELEAMRARVERKRDADTLLERPQPSKMQVALRKLFLSWEAEQLEKLYTETWNKIPKNLPPDFMERMPPSELTIEQVRDRAKAIIGDTGFRLLIEAASPPKGMEPGSLEEMEFMFGNPLGWWLRLKE